MNVYEIDPTTDQRWEDFLQRHPQASIFHTRGWLEALRRTYGYTPIAFTTSPPGSPLTNGIPFCKITGWFGKRRLVALPFSDHCELLVEASDERECLMGHLQRKRDVEGWDYVEIRPTTSILPNSAKFEESQIFAFHKLNVRCGLEEISQNLHRDCVQRKIRRAAREGLTYEEGTSESLLNKFYHLLVRTRHRHGLPIQPIAWFRNLIACLSDSLTLRVASKNGQPVASIVTLRNKRVLVYKYGCSDERFSRTGGTQSLFWRAIQQCREEGFSEFDLGRSDYDNPGLIAFKDRWGATRTQLAYFRYPAKSVHPPFLETRRARIGKYVLSHAPTAVLVAAGRAIYRHLG